MKSRDELEAAIRQIVRIQERLSKEGIVLAFSMSFRPDDKPRIEGGKQKIKVNLR